MSLLIQIKNDLKQALKTKQDLRLSVLRQICATAKNEAINLKKDETELSDAEVLGVIKKESKKRKDAIASYTQGGRADLAQVEGLELEIIKSYLPSEMEEKDIDIIINQVVAQIGTADFGKIMKEVMNQTGGQADGKIVSQMVKKRLTKKTE